MRPCAILIGGIVCLMVSSTGPASADLLDQAAQATIRACDTNQFLGVAFLHERDSEEGVKEVDVTIRIRERNKVLSEGRHGVHIHEVGDCTLACAAAGGHFDPGPAGDPSPDGNHPFHLGDLVNIEIAGSGLGSLHTTTSRVTLSPARSASSMRTAVPSSSTPARTPIAPTVQLRAVPVAPARLVASSSAELPERGSGKS